MRTLAVLLAVCALATPATAWDADETERVSQTFKMEPGGSLRLKNFSGRVTITATDRSEVVVDAVRYGPRERLNRVKLDIHTDGANTVVVDANRHDRSWYEFIGKNSVVQTDFDIKVPRRTHLDVSVFSSPVKIDGVEGMHKAYSFSGRLSLNDVTGSIKAHSFSGPILIRAKSWESNQSINVDTFSGNVELHVPESARGNVSFNSFSGRLNSEMPLTLHSSKRGRLRAELGGGGNGTLTFKTFSGSVKIDR